MIHMVKQLNATLIAAAAVARLLLVARRLIVRGAVAIVAGASDVAIGVVLAIALALAGDRVLLRRHPRCQYLHHLRHSRRLCPLWQRGRPLRQRGRISLTLWRVVDSHLLNVQRRRRSTEFCIIARPALTDDFVGTSRELDGTGFDATCGGRGNGLA